MLFRKREIQISSMTVALASAIGFSVSWVFGVVFLVIGAAIVWRQKKSFLIVACCIGLLRGWSVLPQNLPTGGVVVTGVVSEDPLFNGDVRFPLHSQIGNVEVSSRFSGELRFGDVVIVNCSSLERTSRFKGPRCKAASLTVHRHNGAPGYLRGLHGLKSWLTQGMNRALPSPEAPLLGGILLGSRSALPITLANAFRLTGTSHIVAVSGYNVTIVIALIAGLIGRLPLPRRVVTALTVFSIVGFVILTGASASVVRAGIMGGLAVLARAVGRLSDALHALIVSASVMVLIHPATIADIGFQLSVAATAGLVLLADPFAKMLRWLPEQFGIRESLSTTLAAIAVTEPIIVLVFGRVSLISPIVNLLVLPLIPLSMAVGFAVAMIAALVPALATSIGWIAWLPLTAVVCIVEFAASLRFASITTSPVTSIAIAAGLAMLAVILIRRNYGGQDVRT